MGNPQPEDKPEAPPLTSEVVENLVQALSSSSGLASARMPRVRFVLVGELGRELSPPLARPIAVAVDRQDQVVILDRPGSDHFRLSCSTSDGKVVGEVIQLARGPADAQLLDPASLALDRDRQMYIADAQAGCVKSYGPEGQWLATFTSAGFEGSRLSGPRDVAVDDAGNLYIADTNNDRIVQLLPDGELGWVLEQFAGPGASEDGFYEPYSLCLGGGDRKSVV